MKVVILTAKFGMGHISVANSLKQDILKFHKNASVEVIDYYEYTMPFMTKYIYDGFKMIIKHAKPMYNIFYMENDKPSTSVDILSKKFAFEAKRLVEEKKPDVIISTFPIISQGIGYFKEKNLSDIPLITCITDVSSHYEWINDFTDKYLVSCEENKRELIRKGVDSEKIVVYGIPVAGKFKNMNQSFKATGKNNEISNKKNNIVNFNMYTKKKELLIMGGGMGMLPSSEKFYERLDSLNNVHTTIVTGNNRLLFEKLSGKYSNIIVLGYSKNVDELMRNADCVVTKPGGITLFESIFSKSPIISFSTGLPNEVRNEDFIEENNIGIVLHSNLEYSVDRIEKLINDDSELFKMRSAMSKIVLSTNQNYFKNYMDEFEDVKIVASHLGGNRHYSLQ